MRLIDADALKELILKERDAIPKTVAERYSFGVGMPNSHGNSMRGGIRKALRCMEQTPTIDPESMRQKGRWVHCGGDIHSSGVLYYCTQCYGVHFVNRRNALPTLFAYNELFSEPNFCPNCGADMRGEEDGTP